MSFKIYFSDKPLFIAGASNPEIEPYLNREDTVTIYRLTPQSVQEAIMHMETPAIQAVVILYPDQQAVLQELMRQLIPIQAGGGLVYRKDQTVLLIFRRGKWDLPKGKLDEGEDIATCALREITEETGLANIHLEQPLLTTYHTYYQNDRHILKESTWFLVRAEGQEAAVPQLDEDIVECRWVPVEQLESYMAEAHASVVDVLKKGMALLAVPQA